jgi:hypothetical protein
MEEVNARAMLVDSAPGGTAPGLAATISRDEIEEAISAEDGPADLLLDVTRFSKRNGGEAVESRTVAVTWERGDLERLLRQAEGDAVTLAIDRDSLEQTLEADVEAHGLRERALVLTVAAATAASTAGAVQAALDPSGAGAGGQASQAYAIEDIRAGQPAPESTSAAYPIEDIRAGQPAPEAASGAYPIEDVRAGGTAEPSSEAYPIENVRGSQPAPEPTSEGGGGITISAPSPAEAAGLAGATALAITGAAFALRSRRQPRPA